MCLVALSACSGVKRADERACLYESDPTLALKACDELLTPPFTRWDIPYLLKRASLKPLPQGAEDYEAVLELDPKNPQALMGYGASALKRSELLDAIEFLTKALLLKPSAEGYLLRAKAKTALGDFFGARKDYQLALSAPPAQ